MLGALVVPLTTLAPAAADPPTAVYLDDSGTYSFEERAADLLSRMTREEKVLQLQATRPGAGGSIAPAITRLGLKAYSYWNEALHGVARNGEATLFPTGLGIASTWNPDLVLEMGQAISDEGRAKSNTGDVGAGLTYFSPTINMSRDPRWGRAEEAYGEDPYLTGVIGGAFVDGMQGGDPVYTKSITTPKHYAANNSEQNRRTGSSNMSEQALREYYLPAYGVVAGEHKAGSLMTAYNAVNGMPMVVNSELLETVLRRTWGFDGYVVSDCTAVPDLTGQRSWRPAELGGRVVTATEAVAYTIKAGNDLDCRGVAFAASLPGAINEGLMTEDDMDVALHRVLTARMRLGEFDSDVVWASAAYSTSNQISSASHLATAQTMSDEALVLLRNEAPPGASTPMLPLPAADASGIVVVGDQADELIFGDYSPASIAAADRGNSPLNGVIAAARSIEPAASVPYIAATATNAGTASPNVEKVEFLNSSGTVVRTALATEFTDLSTGYTQTGGYLDGASAGVAGRFSIPNVDCDSFAQYRVYAAGTAGAVAQGKFDIYYGSTAGPKVGVVPVGPTTSATDFQPTSAPFLDGGYNGVQPLVFAYSFDAAAGL
ncbi:MAG: hypothetical protein LBK72_09930, partial [Bifidobacteriaceae bacterium]|nr:hypothetical protein [Bifidobacteriaceae bacterium]